MVGNDDADSFFPEPAERLLKFLDGQGVDSREGLVEKDEPRFEDEGPADFELAPLAATQAVSWLLEEAGKFKFLEEIVGQFRSFLPLVGLELEDEPEILLDGGLEED